MASSKVELAGKGDLVVHGKSGGSEQALRREQPKPAVPPVFARRGMMA